MFKPFFNIFKCPNYLKCIEKELHIICVGVRTKHKLKDIRITKGYFYENDEEYPNTPKIYCIMIFMDKIPNPFVIRWGEENKGGYDDFMATFNKFTKDDKAKEFVLIYGQEVVDIPCPQS